MMDEVQYKEAVHAMESGDGSAKMIVAYYKLLGLGGVEVDVDEAVTLLEESVKEGYGEAMWMLGLCCEHGMGTVQDIERANKLYEESYERGSVIGDFLWKECIHRRVKVQGL